MTKYMVQVLEEYGIVLKDFTLDELQTKISELLAWRESISLDDSSMAFDLGIDPEDYIREEDFYDALKSELSYSGSKEYYEYILWSSTYYKKYNGGKVPCEYEKADMTRKNEVVPNPSCQTPSVELAPRKDTDYEYIQRRNFARFLYG